MEKQVYDDVYSENEMTGEASVKTVTKTYDNEADELVHVYVNGEDIQATPSHPFYVPKSGWTKAINLRAGDILVLSNGEYVVVEAIQHEILESPIKVYNFEVEDFHTYFVGKISVLVHNGCGDDVRKQPGTVTGENLPDTDRMMRGTEGQLGVIPKDIADKLKGREFQSFDEFRSEFWKAVADSKYASEFSASNITNMSQGLAPFVLDTQTLGGRVKYELHHKVPIHAGGGVYDLNNLVIVTPLYHLDVLDRAYHFGH